MSTEITKEELASYANNPEMVIKKVLDLVDEANNEEVTITNATSPFVMLLEAVAVTTSNAISESKAVIRSKYANLALTRNEISHHLSDDELEDIISHPGSVNIIFRVSCTDLKSNGHRPVGAQYVEMTIPEMTRITVLGTDLTLLNDINVRLYDNTDVLTSFVEMYQNDNPLSTQDIGIIRSIVALNNDGQYYIYFTLSVKQLTVNTYKYGIVSSEGFTKVIPFSSNENHFHHIEISYDNSSTNGVKVPLSIALNDKYLDPYVPTAFINIVDNPNKNTNIEEAVEVHIPDTYFINNKISGTIHITVYETKGEFYLPLKDLDAKEYGYSLGLTGKNIQTAVSPNVSMILGSDNIMTSGSSGLNFNELKQAIIFNTKGNQNLPITDYQLSYNLELDGFEVLKDHDVITGRSYVALRNLNKVKSNTLRALQDVYFNTTNILLDDYKDHPSLTIFDDLFVINSGTVFKSYNSMTSIVSANELAKLNKLTTLERVDFYKNAESKYYVTPYFYVVGRENDFTTVRVYDLDRPKLTNMRVLDVNRDIEPRATTAAWAVFKNKEGYEIVSKLNKSVYFDNLPDADLRVTLGIDLVSENQLFIDGVYDKADDVYRFFIKTEHYINLQNQLLINNGVAVTTTNLTNLVTNCNFYIHLVNEPITDPNNFMSDVLPTTDSYVMLTNESIQMTFGNRITEIWAPIAVTFTERKYKRYEEDEYAYYTESVFEVDPNTGLHITVDNNGVSTTLMHKKGEPILNDKGEHVILHHKGDVMIGANKMPILDDLGGMQRHIDICMLDYEFYLATNEAYKKHVLMTIDQINEYSLNVLPTRVNKLLENTNLWYKSYKSCLPINVKINNIIYGLNPIISPTITLYYNQNDKFSMTKLDKNKVVDQVGYILDKYLENKSIRLEDIRQAIKAELGDDILGVKITGIDNNDSEIIYIEDQSTRFSLGKELVLNEYNQLEVKYDITVNIQTL